MALSVQFKKWTVRNAMTFTMYMRKQTEQIIKDQNLDRARAFEVPKLKYSAILHEIESAFVADGGGIHWANMGRYKPDIPCVYRRITDQPLWYHALPEIIPTPHDPVYVLLEDRKGYQPKYWLYEMCLPELIAILDESSGLGDFYIVSKKYQWLISENHEEIASFLGNGLIL